jgi:hypothetical protein
MVERLVILLMVIALVSGMYSAMEQEADINNNIYKRMEVPK